MLTTQFHLVPMLSMGAAMRALPRVTSGHARGPLSFYLLYSEARF